MKHIKTYVKICVLVLLFSFKLTYSQNTYTVYIFLSENCSMSQNYTVKLKDLHSKYGSTAEFKGVFSNYFSSKKSIRKFQSKYKIPFELIEDKDGKLREHFGATVTPEVFVEGQELIYTGRIDDSFYDLGKKRNTVTSNDLEDVLAKISNKERFVGIVKTQAIGSVIVLTKGKS